MQEINYNSLVFFLSFLLINLEAEYELLQERRHKKFKHRLSQCVGCESKEGEFGEKKEEVGKYQHCGDKETHAKSDPEHDVAPSRPVTRSVTANPPRSMTIIAETASLRLQNCSKCKKGPLDLSKIHYEMQRYPGYLHVLCQTCGHVNVINIQNSGKSSEAGEESRGGRKI